MSISNAARNLFLSTSLFVAAVSASGARAAGDETYEWSATLVGFDAQSGTAVLQERTEAHSRIDGLDEYSDGDRLTLVWTGRSWAAGIRDLAQDPELTPGTLSLPVEFVSSERDGEYINFRVKVPASASATIAALAPGTRVTGESPRSTASWERR